LAVLKPAPPTPRLTTVVTDEAGIIVNLGAFPESAEAAVKAEWLGRHCSEVPRHHFATIIGNIDLDVMLGRKPGIPRDRLGGAFKVVREVVKLDEEQRDA
jgi:hypothetical protein